MPVAGSAGFLFGHCYQHGIGGLDWDWNKINEGLALALILGGALGNLTRLTLGYVVDFLDFHWSGWHFAAFNVADGYFRWCRSDYYRSTVLC